MDINTIGIGAIMGATLVAGTNLYIFISNRKKDEIKERLEKLYTPMYVYYMEHMRFSVEDPYKDYLALKRYISVTASMPQIYSKSFLNPLWLQNQNF